MNGLRTLGFGKLGLAAGIAVMLLSSGARAESDYPSRAIHVVVPYPAGGIVDIVARAVTEQVGRDWKVPVVMEDRPGANSNIGTAMAARSTPDGYTWLVTGPAVLVNPTLYSDAGWDAMKDFRCVGLAIWNQSVALVNPAMPAKTLAALVARALAEGLDAATPALAISRATRPDQQSIAAPIADLPVRLQEAALPGPVLVMIGGVCAAAEAQTLPEKTQRAL